jgi:cell division protein FtsQ
MKKVLQISFWILLIAGVIVLLAFIGQKHNETVCHSFDLSIVNPDTDHLITAEELSEMIITRTDTLKGKTLGEIEFYKIRCILNTIPYIKSADIQAEISGRLNIRIILRQPLIRITNKNKRSYYIDTEGYLMPLNPGHPSRVIIANGNIRDGISDLDRPKLHVDSLAANSIVKKLWEMAAYMKGSPFIDRMIGQIWVNASGELEMTPMIGDYMIHFGTIENMEEKFEKLVTFYRKGAGKAGWIDYTSIDLRYKNQVICSKK